MAGTFGFVSTQDARSPENLQAWADYIGANGGPSNVPYVPSYVANPNALPTPAAGDWLKEHQTAVIAGAAALLLFAVIGAMNR